MKSGANRLRPNQSWLSAIGGDRKKRESLQGREIEKRISLIEIRSAVVLSVVCMLCI